MVLTAARNALAPALVIPDEQSWTVWGQDPARLGLEPVLDPSSARRVLAPETVPEPLAEPLRNWVGGSASPLALDTRPAPLADGQPVHSVVAADAPPRPAGHHHDAHGGHDAHAEHEGGEHGSHHDHADMMAITGEPSADGLVMEPIKLTYGPLGTALPGGLIVDITLDGDVVADGTVRAVLEASVTDSSNPSSPDPLSPAAWRAAIDAARGKRPPSPWTQVADVERERAISHLAWLRAFGRLLAWHPLVVTTSDALAALDSGNGTAERFAGAVVALLRRDRVFRVRTRGIARLTSQDTRGRGLHGVVARASGLADDARSDDPLYEQLAFEPLVTSEGDALARALLRAREAEQSIALAFTARGLARDGAQPSGPAALEAVTTEGPRGPLVARREGERWDLSAPGSEAARRAAGDLMEGLEWSSALVALASFDLSPWLVPE